MLSPKQKPTSPRNDEGKKEKKKQKKDEMLWGLLTAVLNGMQLTEGNVKKLLQFVEDNLEDPPNFTKVENTMKSVKSTCDRFWKLKESEPLIKRAQSVIRKRNAVRKYTKLRKTFGYSLVPRNEVFRELVKSEAKYVQNLQLLIEQYLLPLRDLLAKKLVGITNADVADIFCNTEKIYEAHTILHRKFTEELDNWPFLNSIGHIFLTQSYSLSLYSEYVKNFKHSVNIMIQCRQQDERFANFLKEKNEQLVNEGADLRALLSVPLNRISHYKIQFDKLMEFTPYDHADYTNVSNCYAMATELYEFIQESIEQAELQASLFSVQKRIEPDGNEIVDIMAEKRRFIREGDVLMLINKNKKKRHIFLCNDICIITKPTLKNTLKSKEIIPLTDDGSRVETVDDTATTKHAFRLVVPKRNEYIFVWKTREEREQWLKDFRLLFQDMSKNRVFGLPLSELAKRDKTASGCPLLMEKLITYLSKHGISNPTMLRSSLAVNRKKVLRKLVDSDIKKLEVSSLTPTEMCGLLRYFLKSLPDPLFTFDLTPMFIDTADKSNEDKARSIRNLWKRLPNDNRRAIEYLFTFMNNLRKAPRSGLNLLSVTVPFVPYLLRPRYESIGYILQLPKVNSLIQFMLENMDKVVEPIAVSPAPALPTVEEVAAKVALGYVRAKHSFAKRKEGELSFTKGDIIKVVEKHKSGWWKGILNGVYGKFPSNYCTEVDYSPMSSTTSSANSSASSTPTNPSILEKVFKPASPPNTSESFMKKGVIPSDIPRPTSPLLSGQRATSPTPKLQEEENDQMSSPHDSASEDERKDVYFKAMHSFTKRKETELTMNKGDIVRVLVQHKSGWWTGELNGEIGKFPSNYGKVLEGLPEVSKETSSPPKNILYSSTGGTDSSSSTPTTSPRPTPSSSSASLPAVPKQLRVKVLYNFNKRKENELSIQKGDIISVIEEHRSGWWTGVLNGQTGKFPSNYCKILTDDVIPLSASQSKEEIFSDEDTYDLSKSESGLLSLSQSSEHVEEEAHLQKEILRLQLIMEEQARIDARKEVDQAKTEGSTTEEEKSDNPSEFNNKTSPQKDQSQQHTGRIESIFSSVVQLPRSESADSQLQEMSRSPPTQTSVFANNSPKQTSPKQQQATDETSKPQKMRALFNFTARNDREISFKKGDEITILWREVKDGWWRGEINGKQGKFPSNYCELISDEESTSANTPQQPENIQLKQSGSTVGASSPPKVEPVVRVRAGFSFTKRKDGELSFAKGDVIVVLKQHKSGWWKGEFGGQVGLFPSNYCTGHSI